MTENTTTEDKMHGSIFVFLKRFVENSYDHSTWINLLEKSGVENRSFQVHEMYSTQVIFAIVKTASETTGISTYDLMESFGEFLVPDLLLIYKKYVQPEWRTYEMLLYAEDAMHGAVRREDSRTSPPVLLVTNKGKNTLLVDYYSKRKTAGMAVGIIKGIAQYYHENDLVKVTLLSEAEEERVHIQVEFEPEAVPAA